MNKSVSSAPRLPQRETLFICIVIGKHGLREHKDSVKTPLLDRHFVDNSAVVVVNALMIISSRKNTYTDRLSERAESRGGVPPKRM